MSPFPLLLCLPECEREMQLPYFATRKSAIWKKMREIERELFLLSARSGELDSENGYRFIGLCGERTKLANELLLNERR